MPFELPYCLVTYASFSVCVISVIQINIVHMVLTIQGLLNVYLPNLLYADTRMTSGYCMYIAFRYSGACQSV